MLLAGLHSALACCSTKSSINVELGQLNGSGTAIPMWLPALMLALEPACRETPQGCDVQPASPAAANVVHS